MSELDEQLANLRAASDAEAARIVAEHKAKENEATFTGGALTDAELSAKVADYQTAVGTSAPHPAVHHLFALVKHLFARVNASGTDDAKYDPATSTTYVPVEPPGYVAPAATVVEPAYVPPATSTPAQTVT